MRLLFSRQWWWTTLLVIAALGVMVRLGIWQLDRLQQRRTFNARVSVQLAQPLLVLDSETLGADLANMEYRSVMVKGEYDPSQEAALSNQVWNSQPGVHLLTPLRISGSDQAVLVDRGWIPLVEAAPERWGKFTEPGLVEVRGVIRTSQHRPRFGGLPDTTQAPGQGRVTSWNRVNLARLAEQTPYPLLPIYIQQAPDPSWTTLPYRSQPELDLSEGPHLGYAVQWFLFASVLAIGYPFFVRHSTLPHTARPPAAQRTPPPPSGWA
ncbi:MAG: SURF1 family protein [Deinococcus sp.]|nr:SURF1 family protein [Deinococcus sp.]